ncbi:hypothetical protein D9757_009638 [Collybiopsis confluens]|uniref:Protein artemis n=1 Tax=Collybiopsis confluens TaxID=2823264 RepID=A0A8H5GW74_9AGAR|nr:hypothetical protein D9757_009638 [Collybiopsis confluens]
MPPGTPFNSFALPYSIRVDGFSTIPLTSESRNAALYLLSHTHTDHIVGLQAQSFSQTVYCSSDAKQMLLRHEVYQERALHKGEYRAEHKWTYRHLKIDPWVDSDGQPNYHGSRDLLQPIPLNTPTKIELEHDKSIIITVFDANHCPGAVMCDFRAEPWFLESIKHNPFLQPYLAPPDDTDYFEDGDGQVIKTLDAIYLDTACVIQTHPVPTKEDATTGLIALLKLYPSSTYFFINHWTWGYEDILKAIARAFKCKIHLDEYKAKIFSLVSSDPLLRSLGTTDQDETRFHACERFDRCDHVRVDRQDDSFDSDIEEGSEDTQEAGKAAGEKAVVYINPVSSMTPEQWVEYQATIQKKLTRGKLVRSLLVPLSRHSPLPELQSFASLFRPKRIIPNTLDPRMEKLEWAAIDRVFQSCCRQIDSSRGAKPALAPPLIPPTPVVSDNEMDAYKAIAEALTTDDEEDDVAVKNLVGDLADDKIRAAAKKWLTTPGRGVKSSGRRGAIGRRLDILMSWLVINGQKDESSNLAPPRTSDAGSGNLGPDGVVVKRNRITIRKECTIIHRRGSDNDFDSCDDDDDDDRGRTAHQLFASDGAGSQKQADTSSKSKAGIGGLTSLSSSVRPVKGKSKATVSRMMTSTPKGNGNLDSGSQSFADPFPMSQSPQLIAKGRSLHFSPSSPAVLPSPSPVPRFPSSHRKPQRLTDNTANLSSPIHLIPSSSSSRSKAVKKARLSSDSRRRHPSRNIREASSSPPSSPLKDKKRGPEAADPLGELKNIPPGRPNDHRVDSTPSSSANPSQTPGVVYEKRAEARSHPEAIAEMTTHKLPQTVQEKFSSHNNSPMQKRTYSSFESSHTLRRPHSPCRSKSELLSKQLSYAVKAAKARPHLVPATFEANCTKLEFRVGNQQIKERNASDYSTASFVLKRNRVAEAEKMLLSRPELNNEVEGVDWVKSRHLQSLAAEDIRNGRKPIFPPLQCIRHSS